MEFKYENQGSNTYLVYQVGENEVLDSMSLGMLTNNKIPGFASMFYTQMDTDKYVKYNISSKVTMKQFFEGAINKKRLLGVFEGIVSALMAAEDYMIDINTILLDLKYIYVDVSNYEIALICIPLEDENVVSVDIGMFFKEIMFSTQFDQTENCEHVAKIINFLNSSQMLSLAQFKSVLDELITPVASGTGQVQVQQKPNQSVPSKMQQAPSAPVPQAQKPVQVSGGMTVPPGANQVPKQQTVRPQQQVTPAMQPSGMKIPNKQTQAQANLANNLSNQKKDMSMLSLLMHYSKENAAIYKAQQEEKKKNPVKQKTQQKPVKKEANNNVAKPNFAIPGQTPAPVPSRTMPQETMQSMPKVTQQPVPQPTPQVTPQPVQQPIPQVAPQQVQQPTPSARNFGETIVLSGGPIGETTVLEAGVPNVEIKPYLVRIKTQEKIQLDKLVFRIGKEKSYVDYFIGDNTAISRSHANIISRDDTYYVVDTNSTNHTYVNGTMIQSNTEIQISHSDKIRFANEEFEFRMY